MTDTNCQRASQSLYETIAVSLFARLPPRALLAASPLARDSCSATFPRGFSSKRETARSLLSCCLVTKTHCCHGDFAVYWSKLLKFFTNLTKNLFSSMKLLSEHQEEHMK